MRVVWLLVGINYYEAPERVQLEGCVNDVNRWAQVLGQHLFCCADPAASCDSLRAARHDVVVLVERPEEFRLPESMQLQQQRQDLALEVKRPTASNMRAAFRRVAQLAREADAAGEKVALAFHYSGHGGVTVDLDGDERDGRDETLFPCDYRRNGVITDDELRRSLFLELPASCSALVTIDACRSGTQSDLPFRFDVDSCTTWSEGGRGSSAQDEWRARVLMVSACRDNQLASDALFGAAWSGVLTRALCDVLPSVMSRGESVWHLAHRLRAFIIGNGFEGQRPQVSASKPLLGSHPLRFHLPLWDPVSSRFAAGHS